MKRLTLDSHGALIEVEDDEPPMFAPFKTTHVPDASSVYASSPIPECHDTVDDAVLMDDAVPFRIPLFASPQFPDDGEGAFASMMPHRKRSRRLLAIALVGTVGAISGVAAFTYRTQHPPTTLLFPIAKVSTPPIVHPMRRTLHRQPRAPHRVQPVQQHTPVPRPSTLSTPTAAVPLQASTPQSVLRTAPPLRVLQVVTVFTPAPNTFPPKILSMIASPSHIQRGHRTSICVTTDAYKLFLLPSGEQSRYPITCFPIKPSQTTTYTIEAMNAHGTSTRRSITVTVLPPHPPVTLATPSPVPSRNRRERHHRHRAAAARSAVPTLAPTPTAHQGASVEPRQRYQ